MLSSRYFLKFPTLRLRITTKLNSSIKVMIKIIAFEKAFEIIFDFMIKHDFNDPLYIEAQTSVWSHYNIREHSKGKHVVVEGLFNVRNELSPLHVPPNTYCFLQIYILHTLYNIYVTTHTLHMLEGAIKKFGGFDKVIYPKYSKQ